MSICEMNCDTPQEGSAVIYQSMYWGESSIDISSLLNFDLVAYCSSKTDSIISGIASNAYLPTTNTYQASTGMSADGVAEYRNSSTYLSPSPYLADGSRNPSYYQTSAPSSEKNALADFDGRGNTDKILIVRGKRDYATWKPNKDTVTDYPAVSCCDMFSTVGTEQGDWYLPSCGEFGYIIVRLKEINETLDKLKAIYPNTPIFNLRTNLNYWSSSECNNGNGRLLSVSSGNVYYFGKDDHDYVRSFTRLKIT